MLLGLLDAYYLKMERQHRLLYDDAVAGKAAPYDMDASDYTTAGLRGQKQY